MGLTETTGEPGLLVAANSKKVPYGGPTEQFGPHARASHTQLGRIALQRSTKLRFGREVLLGPLRRRGGSHAELDRIMYLYGYGLNHTESWLGSHTETDQPIHREGPNHIERWVG